MKKETTFPSSQVLGENITNNIRNILADAPDVNGKKEGTFKLPIATVKAGWGERPRSNHLKDINDASITLLESAFYSDVRLTLRGNDEDNWESYTLRFYIGVSTPRLHTTTSKNTKIKPLKLDFTALLAFSNFVKTIASNPQE